MPRRGEFAPVAEPEKPEVPVAVEPARIGRRVAVAAYREGTSERVLDPGAYVCSTLVAQLADEWVDYMALTRPHYSTVGSYQIAVKSLATWADKHAETPQGLSLDGDGVAVVKLILDWTRKLPSGYKAGSQRPSEIASQVRSLMQLRAERPGTAVAEPVLGLLAGPPWMRVGMGNELDEFSRKEKKALIRAAWADVREMDVRLDLNSIWASPAAEIPTPRRTTRRASCVRWRRCGAWNAATPSSCPRTFPSYCCSPTI